MVGAPAPVESPSFQRPGSDVLENAANGQQPIFIFFPGEKDDPNTYFGGADYKALEGKDVGAYVTKLLQTAFPAAEFKAASVDEVGSIVGADLKKSGTYAVILSLVAILVYVAFRFRFGFGLGAVLALTHDALISIGLFSLCGRQSSLIVITAVLTIIGYSVNDTVVVFDRIRENRGKFGHVDRNVVNDSINQTLSRTLLTGGTTILTIFMMYIYGGAGIHGFTFALLVGIVVGDRNLCRWGEPEIPAFDAEQVCAALV